MMRNSQWLPTAWILVLPWVQCPSPYDPPLLFPHGWHAGTPDQANERQAHLIAICDVHSNQPLTTYSTIATVTRREPATLHTVSAHPGGSEDILHTFHGGGPLPGVAAYEPAGLATHGEFPTSFEASYLLDHLLVQPGQMISDSFEAAVPQYALWHNMQPHHYGDTVLQLAPNSPRMSHSRVVPPYPPYSWPTASAPVNPMVASHLPEGFWSHSDPRIHETSHPENLIAPNPMATPARPHSVGQTNVALGSSQHNSYSHPVEGPLPSLELNPSSSMVPRDQPGHLIPGAEEPRLASFSSPERPLQVYGNTEPLLSGFTEGQTSNLPPKPHGKEIVATDSRMGLGKRLSDSAYELKLKPRGRKRIERLAGVIDGRSDEAASEDIPSVEDTIDANCPYTSKFRATIEFFNQYLKKSFPPPESQRPSIYFIQRFQVALRGNGWVRKVGYKNAFWQYWLGSAIFEARDQVVDKANLSHLKNEIMAIAEGIPAPMARPELLDPASFKGRVVESSTTFMTMVKALDYRAGEYIKYKFNTHTDLDSELLDFLTHYWKEYSVHGQESEFKTGKSKIKGKVGQFLLYSYGECNVVLKRAYTTQYKLKVVQGLLNSWVEREFLIRPENRPVGKVLDFFRAALWSYADSLR